MKSWSNWFVGQRQAIKRELREEKRIESGIDWQLFDLIDMAEENEWGSVILILSTGQKIGPVKEYEFGGLANDFISVGTEKGRLNNIVKIQEIICVQYT